MSFVFRGSRGDIETGFPDFIPERRAVRLNAASRPPNSVTFLVTVLLLFMILNSQQMSPNILLWLLLAVFLLTTGLRMYATCQQLRAQAHAAAASGLLSQNEFRLHVPPSLAFVTRGHLQSLRLQLALLDRQFDNLDDIVSRSLESDVVPDVPSMTEEQINTLPVHKYKVQSQHGAVSGQKSDGSLQQQTSSSSIFVSEKKQDDINQEGSSKIPEDELTCSVCLDQVNTGDLLRTLPCLHQFHMNCIDPWLRQKGTCPVCKHRVSSAWNAYDAEVDASSMV